MKIDFINVMEWAERFSNRELSAVEIATIQKQLSQNEDLAQEWASAVSFFTILKDGANRQKARLELQAVAADFKNDVVPQTVSIPFKLWKRFGKMGSIAAGVAIAASVITYQLATNTSKINNNSQFISLKREVEHIKSSQAELQQTISEADKKVESVITGDVIGTGFAITNDGYLATDYHVVEKADSIFIQTQEGKFFKAYLVGFDEKNDVAILKLENKKAKLTKGELPYAIATTNASLAQSIYSLGFPQEDAMYVEGYISSNKGLGGDRNSYQLDLPANPGQSGSPIFDKNGNIIGMLIGKKTFSTYATKSQVLLDLIHSLPAEYKIQIPAKNLIKNMSRQEQVDMTLGFVYAVRVYKKVDA